MLKHNKTFKRLLKYESIKLNPSQGDKKKKRFDLGRVHLQEYMNVYFNLITSKRFFSHVLNNYHI